MNEIVVVAGIIVRDGKILVTQRPPVGSAANLWEFPGGKVEADESQGTALQRELLEELNVRVRLGGKIGEFVAIVESRQIRLVCFWASIASGEPELRSHQAAVWCEPQELLELDLAPPDIPAVAAIRQGWDSSVPGLPSAASRCRK